MTRRTTSCRRLLLGGACSGEERGCALRVCFADFPDDFLIDPYVIDGDEWAEGFVIVPRPYQCQ